MKTQRSIHALGMVQNLSVQRWTLHILNRCHVGDVVEVAVIIVVCVCHDKMLSLPP